jgi:hypothetical protein
MPRDCLICLDADKTKVVAELIATGVSDRAIARQIGGVSHMSVARHRQNHVARPAQAFARAAARTHEIRVQRERAIQAAENGDLATAFLSLEQIAADLRRVQERLERTADAAEADSQRLAVASLSGQQLRAAEVRAKLAGVGGYAPMRSAMDSGVPVVIERVERIIVESPQFKPIDDTIIEHDEIKPATSESSQIRDDPDEDP